MQQVGARRLRDEVMHLLLVPGRDASCDDQPYRDAGVGERAYCCERQCVSLARVVLADEQHVRRLGHPAWRGTEAFGDTVRYDTDPVRLQAERRDARARGPLTDRDDDGRPADAPGGAAPSSSL